MPLTLGESARNVIASHDTAITTVLAYATMSATACGWREEGMLDKISESGGGGALVMKLILQFYCTHKPVVVPIVQDFNKTR